MIDAVDGLVCDLDGVIYRGDEPIPGAAEAVGALRDRGVKVVFCTNNSRATVEQYLDKLARMGVRADPDEIVTSAVVTGEMLAARDLAGKRALVVGGDGLALALRSAGIVVDDRGPFDLVAVGLDPHFTYEKMRRASMAVRAGAVFVATNDDASFPAAGDEQWPGAGALLASIEVASGRRAEVMGKPHQPMMEAAARRLAGCERIAIVGDRPDTDLRGGRARGWKTVLVLSGVTSPSAAEALAPAPDLIVGSIADLARSTGSI